MSVSDDEISRRDFLNKTAKAGLVFYTIGPLSAISPTPLRKNKKTTPSTKAGETEPHRYIDQSLCIGCGKCEPLCPLEAITLGEETSSIDPDECAECGACFREEICPADAIKPVKLKWPRDLRETFSNPLAVHKSTGITGRGTEGIKTNDSQNRYKRGEIGVFIEVGRPVLGGRFSDVERIVKKFKANGYTVIPQNPISDLIDDPKTGALKPEILNERVISCVIEFNLPNSAAGKLMTIVGELAREVDSLFSLSVGLRADEQWKAQFEEIFGPDVSRFPNAKANIGVLRPVAAEEA
ncbi:indolepyruvate ferredoxin oxidoreductase subunit alpha [Acidobacteriota bacterium]